MSIKFFIKKIVPATFFKVEEEGQRVIDELKKENEKSYNEMRTIANLLRNLQFSLKTFQENVSNDSIQFRDKFVTKSEKTNDLLINQHHQVIEQLESSIKEINCWIGLKNDELLDCLMDNQEKNMAMKRTLDEIAWAHIFNNAISDSSWLDGCSLCPGKWAMGYVELYVLYRTLNEFKPKSILELGLGQSTKMIAKYVKTDQSIIHKVVENDVDWINFMRKNADFADNTDIIYLDNEMVTYKGINDVRVYKNFKENVNTHKYSLMVVDAPLGSDMKQYSRIDILSILPECLEKSFVIILDDVERPGEKATIKEVDEILTQNEIEFKRNIYRGNKEVCIWTSADWRFLCSM